MSLFIKLRNFLLEPRLRGVDYNSDELLNIHRQILSEKRFMRDVFSEFYKECISLDNKYFHGVGQRVEIGAGVSFFKEQFPFIISTDIKKAGHLDMILDAQNMNLQDNSVRAIYGLNCFHHFPEPARFFSELDRVLVKGGGCILIEPYYGAIATRFYKNLHSSETFDKSQIEWSSVSNQIMVGANQALSYIVFVRDRKLFRQLFPGLEIVCEKRMNNYMRYLLSGGLNFKPLLPYFFNYLIRIIELILIPFNKLFALHHLIIIRKKQ
jgi:SAM-dependent methyltransferase